MGPILALKLHFTRAFDVTGRSRRSEFIWATLFYGLILALVVFLIGTVGTHGQGIETGTLNLFGKVLIGVFGVLWIGSVVPWITLSIRRFHDMGQTGWLVALFFGLYFIPIIGLLGAIGQFLWLFFGSGAAGTNAYGQDPRHEFRYEFD